MLKLYCDGCSQEITELHRLSEGFTPERVDEIVEILEDLEQQLLNPDPIEFFEETVAGVGIGCVTLELLGRWCCNECLRRHSKTGRFLPEQLYS